MTIAQFFYLLLTVWLPYEKYLSVSREAFQFYCWLAELKTAAFLPGQNSRQIGTRLSKLRSCISKMPTLSPTFYFALSQLDGKLLSNLNPAESKLLLEKRDRVATLIDFLVTIDEPSIVTLRAMMLQNNKGVRLKKTNHIFSPSHDSNSPNRR